MDTSTTVQMLPIYQAKSVVRLALGEFDNAPAAHFTLELHGDWSTAQAQKVSEGLVARLSEMVVAFAKEIEAQEARVAAKAAAKKGSAPESTTITPQGKATP